MIRKARLFLRIAAAGAIALSIASCGSGGDSPSTPPPSIAISGVYPPLDPAETHYVSRCGRGAPQIRAEVGGPARIAIGSGPEQNGVVEIGSAVRPGEDFPVTLIEDERRTIRVRCLPADFPDWRFNAIRPVGDDLFVVSFKPSPQEPQWIIAFDTAGTPRWWYRREGRVLWAQILRDGSVTWPRSFGDGYGQRQRMAHEVRTLSGHLLRLVRTQGSITDGHEFRETGEGRVLINSYAPRPADLRRVGGPRRGAIVTPEVQELDRRGRVIWRWSSNGRVRLGETRLRWWARVLANPRRRLSGLRTFDPVHINAIEPSGPDEIIISARHNDAIYGIDRATGNIAWKLGGRGRAEGLEVIDDPVGKRFGGQHDVRLGDDGELSVYDNAKLRGYRPRVAFYRLELPQGRARFVGQLRDPLIRASHCCGSARQLADGGWLVSWGDNPLVTGFDSNHRLAFRLRLPVPTYRAVPVPPGAVTIGELDRSLDRMLDQDRETE